MTLLQRTFLGRHRTTIIKAALLLLLALLIVRSAWVCDDAAITFRTVDNFTHGYGLRWNVDERVDSYTHPLWMFVLSLVSLFTHDLYYTSLVLSLLLSMPAAYLLWSKLAANQTAGALAILGLIASKPFVDFATSGLENPLTYLMLVLFFMIYFQPSKSNRKSFLLSLLASLVVLNRMDLALIVAPPVIYDLLNTRRLKAWLVSAAGTAPFVLWEIFSLFYYGFPFPNTAYAKLSTGIARQDLVAQGLYYLQNGVEQLPFTAFIIVAAFFYAVLRKSLRLTAPAIGILLYVLYIVRVGGDFMEGRFLTAPFFVAVIILARHSFTLAYRESTLIAVTALSLGFIWPYSPLRADTNYGKGPERLYFFNGIADERAGYYQRTSPLLQNRNQPVPNHPWVVDGLRARRDSTKLIWRGGVGFVGYFAGPHVHIVDKHALTDPLLARLPMYSPLKWRIGHFTREEPEGYSESLQSGENQISDSSLADFYDKLVSVTRGPLFSWARVKEIWKFNTGQYDHLLDEYNSRPRQVALDHFNTPKEEGTAYNASGCMLFLQPGLKILIGQVTHATRVEVSLDCNDEYTLHFLRGTNEHGTVTIKPRPIRSGGLRIEVVDVPKEAVDSGYYYILITPGGGDGTYSAGHLRLLD